MSQTDRVREILDLAMERPSSERSAFVSGATGNDMQLRAEVLSLLAALEGAGDALEPPSMDNGEQEVADPLTGMSFGPYVVGERIGEGGMGVVYATRDTRLERTVAVKALPPSLSRDPHRRARFEQEARLLASLNHPNIAGIYGVEETPRGPVMILEFVPGRTLTEEIKEHALSMEEALEIARQIARGLAAAHEAGIVHRDLKPANIKRTVEGVVKILDFGIAKGRHVQARKSDGVTLTGAVIGTACYMSPEQARGKPVDRRTDMWAFGCVLFEMLTGRRAFDGDTASDVAAAVLRGEPDWSLLPSETSVGVRRLLRKTIEKDAEKRLRDASDAILELDSASDSDIPAATRPNIGAWVALGVLVAAAAGVAIGATWKRSDPEAASSPLRFSVQTRPINTPVIGGCAAISPDGKMLAYVAWGDGDITSQLYVRRLDSFESQAVPGADNVSAPFFSPDSKWIGFTQTRDDQTKWMMKVPADGGSVQPITKEFFYSASWCDDNQIIYCSSGGVLRRIPASGGTSEPLTPELGATIDTRSFSQPEALPGSKVLLYADWTFDGVNWLPRIAAVNLKTGHRHTVLEDACQPRFAANTGMLAFERGGMLMCIPLDAATARVSGTARLVSGTTLPSRSPFAHFAVSRNGSIALVSGNSNQRYTSIFSFGLDGKETSVFQGVSALAALRVSPDGQRLAFTTEELDRTLWVLDIARGAPQRLAHEGNAYYPVWTPNGERIAFEWTDNKSPSTLAWTAADGTGVVENLFRHSEGRCFPTGFSSDGKTMLVSAHTVDDFTDIYTMSLDGERKLTPIFPTREDRVAARFSPDGTMLAYSSTESGRPEIYVVNYPSLDRKILVSINGGERPIWSADSRRLYFRYLSTIFTAAIGREPTLAADIPKPLLENLPGARYDMSPDEKRFYMFRTREESGPQTKIDLIIGELHKQSR